MPPDRQHQLGLAAHRGRLRFATLPIACRVASNAPPQNEHGFLRIRRSEVILRQGPRHGGEQAPISDGHPEAWFTFDGKQGETFVTNVYTYPNSQESATFLGDALCGEILGEVAGHTGDREVSLNHCASIGLIVEARG